LETLKENILHLLRESANRPLKMKEIAKALELGDEQTRTLRAAVRELLEEGEVVETRGKRFGAPEHMNLVVGTFTAHPDGYGFVEPLPRPGQTNLPDIYVAGREVKGAMHRDKVVVRVMGRLTAERLRGKIIRVLERAHLTIVGVYEQGRTFSYVKPIDERITQYIYVDDTDSLEAWPGQVVEVELTEYPSHHKNPEGRIIDVLGWKDAVGLDTEVLIRKHGLPSEFPPEVTEAAEKLPREIPESELEFRTDLRDLLMVTIDPVEAKDHDDAVSIEIAKNGNYLLGVHIADVSYYVERGGVIDEEAYQRATSVYLEDRVIPMLPERLSNDLCSLREHEDRLAYSVRMEITPEGDLVGYEIFDSIIRVTHKMNYDQALAILEGDAELKRRYSDFADSLFTMNALAQKLREKRMKRGSLDFEFPEARAIFGSEGQVVDIVLRRQTISHQLIEDFMLLANETVARHVTGKKAPMVYRIHEEPDPERMGAFREFIASLGYTLTEEEARTPNGLQRVSREARGKPEEKLINYLMLRSLREARYSPENVGHFGLACDCYTHFTSPIRRYPDLVVHRILRALARRGRRGVVEDYGEGLERITEHCSLREREAMEAERESLLTKQIMFMSDKVGDVFKGRITGVHSYGLFVELLDFLVEGLIHISTMGDDYYTYIDEKHCLLGEHSGKKYRLGDEVTVQVVRVDTERKRMDFILAEEEPGTPAKKKRKEAPRPGVAAPRHAGPKRRRGRAG
jgi:ribonuclease R